MAKMDFKEESGSPDTPPSGYVRIYPKADGIFYYKDDAGTETSMGPASTEQIQDAIGALIADSSTIDVTYNDAGNVMSFAVIASAVDHNSLLNFVANKHIDHSAVSITAGTGLTGGGDITATRTLSIANTGVAASTYGSATAVPQITVNAQGQATAVNTVNISVTSAAVSDFSEAAQDAVGGILTDTASVDFTYNDVANTIAATVLPAGVNHNSLQNYVANQHVDHSTISISPGTGLSGGGDLTATRTLNIANTGVGAATYGSASAVPVIAVNGQGQVTSATNTTIAVTSSAVSDFTEAAQDASSSMITAATHTGVSVAYNDAANTLTITNTDGGAAAVVTHTAASDPHPQYLTSTEGDASYQPLDADLTALAANTGTGILVRTGAGTVATRFIAVSTGLGSSAPDGVSGNPTIFNADTGSAAVSSHVAAGNPHTQYALLAGGNTFSGNQVIGSNGTLTVQNTAATAGMVVTPGWSAGSATWINLDTSGPSGIGTGGPGSSPWVAYASGGGQWFTDSASGDVCYRNTAGRILFGTTSGNSVMRMTGSDLTIGPTGTALTNNPLSVNGNVNSFLQSNVQNLSTGTSASGDVICTADNGTDSDRYIDMGVNNSTYADAGFTINGPNDGYLYVQGGDLAVGTGAANKIVFFTGGTLAANEVARITATGQLAVGATAPNAASKLQLDSTTQGFLPPRMTSTQRDAISSPPAGLTVYDTTLGCPCYFNGSVWLFELDRVVQNNQTSTSTTYADVTELVTPSLPVGRYGFQFNGTCQSTATTTGVGVRLGAAASGGATISALVGGWSIAQAANGTASRFEYSQLSATENVTSASALTANADFPVLGHGVFSIGTAGAMAIQIRTETGGTGVSIRINSNLNIWRLTG